MNNPHKKYDRKFVFSLILIFLAVMAIMWMSRIFLNRYFQPLPIKPIHWRKCNSNQKYFPMPVGIPKFIWRKTGLVTLWFDNAWLSQFTMVAPIIEIIEAGAALSIRND